MERFQIIRPTTEQKEYVTSILDPEKNPTVFYQNPRTRIVKPEERHYSLLGEIVVQDALSFERTKYDHEDQGFDVLHHGTKIDVKTRIIYDLPSMEDEVQIFKNQINSPAENEYLLFLLFHEQQGVFYVAGIMSKKGFINTSELFTKGMSVRGKFTISDEKGEIYRTAIKNLAPVRLPA